MRCDDTNPIYAIMEVKNPNTNEIEVWEVCKAHYEKRDPIAGKQYWETSAIKTRIIDKPK
ncbi:hypothetical protein NsoK4_04345 [Nitrosopumilus sp. K4]|uniref:hypothetical protein n=1 Tax=Nitrosopumilus sp. K4 TaxID=2795383 RepID=UPI001BA6E721|nr:hypothetical protein [Nitrosopumilus sp. K4]QUC65479.1 hypothetical protein NsoK4_04345 [Nitrosopumilus sp. K4]